MVTQRVHNNIGIFKDAKFNNGIHFAETTLSLAFGLIFDRRKLNLANSSGFNFRKYTPLD